LDRNLEDARRHNIRNQNFVADTRTVTSGKAFMPYLSSDHIVFF
jgi:hypothetical protein